MCHTFDQGAGQQHHLNDVMDGAAAEMGRGAGYVRQNGTADGNLPADRNIEGGDFLMIFQKKRCVAMLLAGGQGSRLKVLTENTAKPAVPFGGKYRIIDFPLSNCVNSGIDTVGILTQYKPLELNEYIGNGQPWGLKKSHGRAQVLPPYSGAKKSEWYKGTANAIYQNLAFI